MQKPLRSRKYSVSICLEGQQAYDMNSAAISSPILQHDARFRCHHRSGYRAGRHPFIPWHGRCGCAIWGNMLGDCCLNMFEYFPIFPHIFPLVCSFCAPPHRIPSAIGRCRHDRLEDVTTLGRPGGAPTVLECVVQKRIK